MASTGDREDEIEATATPWYADLEAGCGCATVLPSPLRTALITTTLGHARAAHTRALRIAEEQEKQQAAQATAQEQAERAASAVRWAGSERGQRASSVATRPRQRDPPQHLHHSKRERERD